jgi:PAS domain S-box-containing protein
MEKPAISSEEPERLAALAALRLLDTESEPRFDRLTRLAQRFFGVPTALVSLIDGERQWFKSRQGFEVQQTHRDISFCGHAIHGEGVFCVPNALEDPRFADNPLVIGPPHVRFYAGTPLHAPSGHRVGTLCILDNQPREMSSADVEMLLDLGAAVDEEIGRAALIKQARAQAQSLLEQAITRAQSEFIGNADRSSAFEALLEDLLALTESEYGFIGEVLRTPEGAPYLKTYAITNIAWNDATRDFYEREAPAGMVFSNLATLFGAALSDGNPVIANEPGSDRRSGGLPQGHPSLDAFLGIPVHHGGELVAMFGLANRPGGYAEDLIEFLMPLTATLGQLVAALRFRDLHFAVERRLQYIIDGTRIGTWEWNVQTGETIFNERWAEMVGYTLDELAPVSIETWGRLAHPDDLQASNALLGRHFRGEIDYYDFQCRMRHKDGRWIWVHDRGRLVTWSDDGKPLLMCGTHADVTEQKTAQIELEVSQARLEGLFELSPVGLALQDRVTGAFLEVNEALLASIGYGRAELMKLFSWDITPPEYMPEEQRQLQVLDRTGRYTQYEKEYIRKDGSRYPVLLSGMTIEDASDRKLVWSIIQDISEQKALLHQTQIQRDSLHSLLDELEIGTLLLESDGRISFASSYCSTMGLEPGAAEGRLWSDVLPLRHDERVQLDRQLRATTGKERQVALSWSVEDREFFVECEIRDMPTKAFGQNILCLRNVSELRRLQQQLMGSQQTLLLGTSAPMLDLFRRISEVARGDWNVLIEGETGVGKELVARSVHDASPRRDKPFIAINAAGLSEQLLASQLFGHRKGAFTGAVTDQQGFFEAAAGGTLFLDEIGDLPLSMQASILRALEAKEIVQLGETRARKIDVRIVTATHKDLGDEVAAGRFRQDLLYRLRVARLHVPALREHKDDIPLLAEAFLERSLVGSGDNALRLSSDAIQCLMAHDWPGNVRELKASIDHAVIHCRGDVIRRADLPPELSKDSSWDSAPAPAPAPAPAHDLAAPAGDERARILAALDETRGNRARAAALLGISRATFYRHLSRLGITPDR